MTPASWMIEDDLQYEVDQRSLSYEVSDRFKIAKRFEPAVGQKNSRRARHEKRRGAGAKSHNGVHRRGRKQFAA